MLLIFFIPLSAQGHTSSPYNKNLHTGNSTQSVCTEWLLEGYLNDVSPDERWILYRVPKVWESDEYREGSLRLIDTETGKAILVDNNIFIESLGSKFLDNQTILMPSGGSLELYDIKDLRQPIKVLFTLEERYNWLRFSLSEDRTKIAFLLHDRIDRNARKLVLRIMDLTTNQRYDIGYHTFEPEGCADYASVEEILWYGDNVIYSFSGNLYYHKLYDSKTVLLSDCISIYKLHGNKLIFSEWGNQPNSNKSHSFDNIPQPSKREAHMLNMSEDFDENKLLYAGDTLLIEYRVEPAPVANETTTDKEKLLIKKKKSRD